MEQEKEAVYLINGDKYLHLRENGAGVGFATYRRFTGEPLGWYDCIRTTKPETPINTTFFV